MATALWPHREINLLQREQPDVLFRKGGGTGVERAFNIVALITEHLTDADDEVSPRLAGAPVVADADFLRVYVGVKDRAGHTAERRAARVIERQKTFGAVRRGDSKTACATCQVNKTKGASLPRLAPFGIVIVGCLTRNVRRSLDQS